MIVLYKHFYQVFIEDFFISLLLQRRGTNISKKEMKTCRFQVKRTSLTK
jgi:hypothetical protein